MNNESGMLPAEVEVTIRRGREQEKVVLTEPNWKVTRAIVGKVTETRWCWAHTSRSKPRWTC